ncbi:MAG TPA: thiamine pyrophosphate-binding protein [Alphaproteobacteria bacterium]|nr:thiamine pyrophosphate-binding protein [Alphaproteobacteria bacterium]
MPPTAPEVAHDWARDALDVLRNYGVTQVATVPDAGLTRLLDLIRDERTMRLVTLTSEEEGVGLVSGAWLGGGRSALLMQSSGVGNCINTLSLPSLCGIPLLMIVTMRGEWGEFNPWQVPMGQAVRPALAAMGVRLFEVFRAEEAGEIVAAAARLAFSGGLQAAVLITQRMLGAKPFKEE